METQKVQNRDIQKSKQLSGRTATSLTTNHINCLQKSTVPYTDDSKKYQWDVVTNTQIQAIVHENELICKENVLKYSDNMTFGVVLRETPFYSESGWFVAVNLFSC